MAANSSTNTPVLVQICDISIDFSKSNKTIESAELHLSGIQRLIARLQSKVGNSQSLQETFVPPLELYPEDSFSLRLLCKKRFSKHKIENVEFDTGDVFNTCSGVRKRHNYRKSHDGIAIVVKLVRSMLETDSIYPNFAPDDISSICPRIRILVIGKAGVGKSSLINHAFGVKEALSSDSMPGEAMIDTEFISPQNNRFVLHDSKGFEPGEEDNVNIVQDFMERRRRKEALGERLHAVWLCFEIPRAGGRLLETGTEDFLRLKRDGALGKIPVVVVLTKYDKFIDHVDRTFDDSALEGLSDDAVHELIKKTADTKLREICTLHLERFAGEDIPSATVSTAPEHKEMIANLIQITEDRAYQHVASEASMMTSIAQSPSQSHLPLVAPEAMLRDLTEYISKTGKFPDARGGFGEVWKCICQTDEGPIYVAVKSLLVYTCDEVSGIMKKKSKRILRELITCARLKHPNILPVHGYTTDFGPLMAIVSPWAENGNLNVYLEKEGNVPVIRRFEILRDIAAGLRYLHANDVIHGDLTGMNVLILGDRTACIADFGLSLLSSELMSMSQASSTLAGHGNVRWLAPELLRPAEADSHVRPNKCSDIYSFGSVILQVLTNKVPYYYHRKELVVICCVNNGEKPDRSRYPTFHSKYWDLIEECWSDTPYDRPSVERVAEEIENEFESLSTSGATS